METLLKCKCQHCDQNIEFESADAGRNVNCPGCNMETVLFIPRQPAAPGFLKPDSAPATSKTAAQQIRHRAETIEGAAIFISVLAGGALLLAIAAFSIDSNFGTGGIFVAVIGTLLGAASWLYVMAQIIHIRANTHKDL